MTLTQQVLHHITWPVLITAEDTMDTWSATTIKPNYINHNEEAKMPDRGNIPNDYIVGSTLDLAPGHINYSTDSLTTYFTMMSYLMGTFECSMCYAWEEFKICFFRYRQLQPVLRRPRLLEHNGRLVWPRATRQPPAPRSRGYQHAVHPPHQGFLRREIFKYGVLESRKG